MQIYEISRTPSIKKASFLDGRLIFPSTSIKKASFLEGTLILPSTARKMADFLARKRKSHRSENAMARLWGSEPPE